MTAPTLYVQDPVETIDYDLPFATWLAAHSDSISTWDAEADIGLTLVSAAVVANNVRAFVTGGLNGHTYRVAADITTAGGRFKREEILIFVSGEAITGPVLHPGGPLFLDLQSLLLDSYYLVLS